MGVCRTEVGRGGVNDYTGGYALTLTPPRYGRNRKEKGRADTGHGIGQRARRGVLLRGWRVPRKPRCDWTPVVGARAGRRIGCWPAVKKDHLPPVSVNSPPHWQNDWKLIRRAVSVAALIACWSPL
jgi:hypothetical protein